MNTKKEILELVKKKEIIAISIGSIGDKGWNYEEKPLSFFPKTKVDEALKILDFEFNGGYGGEEGYDVFVWTKDWIIFKSCYDGAEWYNKIPRKPNKKIKPESFGGC